MFRTKYFFMRNFLIFLLICMVVTASAAAQERTLPQSREQITLSFSPLVKQVAPAVVSISSSKVVTARSYHPFLDDPFFAPFFGREFYGGGLNRRRVENALGSGVIVRPDGLTVTNAHVISGADEVTVQLSDGRELPADILLVDEPSDLALLRIRGEEERFPFAEIRPSDSLEVGDLVLAIGNPFGVGQTVTSGIVSARARPNLNINDYNFFIQTDAAINPGNSGGPLVAMDGRVVGINSAIYSRDGGSLGIGFAVPSEMVAVILAAEKSGQSGEKGIVRAWLGITAQELTTDIADSLGLSRPSGVLIAELHKESPARKAGIKAGDVVTHIDGREVRNAAEMKFRWAMVPIGEESEFTVLRKEKERIIKVRATTPPDDPPRNETLLEGRHAISGATIANINPAVTAELGLDHDEEKGVVVLRIDPRSRAARVVSPGDILVQINGVDIENVRDAQKALQKSVRGIQLVVRNGGRTRQVMIR